MSATILLQQTLKNIKTQRIKVYSVGQKSLFSTCSQYNKNAKFPEPQFDGQIPIRDLKITYSTSSGPGGQNVNKVATKVDIRVHIESVSWLSPDAKMKILEKLKPSLTKDGWLVTKSEKTRSQSLNQEDAIQKLRENLRLALEPPKPVFTEEELKKMRKGKLKANRERLINKKHRGDTKQSRGGPGF